MIQAIPSEILINVKKQLEDLKGSLAKDLDDLVGYKFDVAISIEDPRFIYNQCATIDVHVFVKVRLEK